MSSHFVGGALKFVLFHGQDRPRQTEDLKPFDLVLTTYATLAADCKGLGLLQKMQWYRVVLDEGVYPNTYMTYTWMIIDV